MYNFEGSDQEVDKARNMINNAKEWRIRKKCINYEKFKVMGGVKCYVRQNN